MEEQRVGFNWQINIQSVIPLESDLENFNPDGFFGALIEQGYPKEAIWAFIQTIPQTQSLPYMLDNFVETFKEVQAAIAKQDALIEVPQNRILLPK